MGLKLERVQFLHCYSHDVFHAISYLYYAFSCTCTCSHQSGEGLRYVLLISILRNKEYLQQLFLRNTISILENMTFYNIDQLYRWRIPTIIDSSHVWLCPQISCVILRLIKYKRPNMFRYLKLPTAFIAYKAFWWVPNKFNSTCLHMCASFLTGWRV